MPAINNVSTVWLAGGRRRDWTCTTRQPGSRARSVEALIGNTATPALIHLGIRTAPVGCTIMAGQPPAGPVGTEYLEVRLFGMDRLGEAAGSGRVGNGYLRPRSLERWQARPVRVRPTINRPRRH